MVGCYAEVPRKLLAEFHERYPVRGALSFYIQVCLEKAVGGPKVDIEKLLKRGSQYDTA
jgi:hypothetical protein